MTKTRDREYKIATFTKELIGERTVAGVFSTFGVLDSYRDIVHGGAFTKTFQERGGKILHLWQHNIYEPATAVIQELKEVDRTELPENIRKEFPEATGGAMVVRRYVESPRADEILQGIKAGVPYQMSFGYDTIRYEWVDGPGEEEAGTRHLYEVRLWETSDVLWGANSATVASKLGRPLIPMETLLAHLDAYLSKEGRRNAGTDQERINQIALMAYELGADNVKLITPDEDLIPEVEEEGEESGDKGTPEGPEVIKVIVPEEDAEAVPEEAPDPAEAEAKGIGEDPAVLEEEAPGDAGPDPEEGGEDNNAGSRAGDLLDWSSLTLTMAEVELLTI